MTGDGGWAVTGRLAWWWCDNDGMKMKMKNGVGQAVTAGL